MTGTSPGISIPEDDFSSQKNIHGVMTGAEVDYAGKKVEVKPPYVTMDNLSQAVKLINPYPEFAFEKLQTPDYGADKDCIARYTGIPINKPDYLNDYYFISLMRLIDMMLLPEYSATIRLLFDSPKPES